MSDIVPRDGARDVHPLADEYNQSVNVYRLFVAGLPILHSLWWWWADRRLRGLPRARLWRRLLGVFASVTLGLYVWLAVTRHVQARSFLPVVILVGLYAWYLVVAPATTAGLVAYETLYALGRLTMRRLRPASQSAQGAPEAPACAGRTVCGAAQAQAERAGLTRRQLLVAAAVAAPPLAAAALHARALTELDDFRVRRLEVALPALPRALDGLTIAQVSDVHVGRFTRGPILDKVIACTNDLRADLVVLTGDLIDSSLDDLPTAIAMVQRFERPDRVFLCEGNHDLFESRTGFERGVRSAGLRLLLDESATVALRGTPVQLLGIRWAALTSHRTPGVAEHVRAVAPLLQPGAFSILLAHHPHAFDHAVEAGIPLTLAGHTHGGQLMLTSQFGAGSLLFKYWSGLYRRGTAALVVSNGVGNWLPVRINAPAEIVHVTLRTADPRQA